MEVTLTPEEMLQASVTGARRRILALEQGRKDRYGWGNMDYWGIDIEGCLAELAAAKAMGLYWGGISDSARDEGDINGIEVRSTKYKKGSLILHPDDPDERVFILVVGAAPEYNVAGWIRAKHGKKDKWWQERQKGRPCYFVPQDALKDVSTTPRKKAV